ncbi:MAG: UDP-N-acetylglucosamine 1-carboxyvinyltransferase [Clostridiales bacterium]|nr:UDP-N-acetylglucosamine 1-carboxyvinyltransferase [Clostridiales bacterium]
MDKIVIHGGVPLRGNVEISGSKNAALPIIIASILTEDVCVIENLPCINDVSLALDILKHMGASVRMLGKNTVEIDTKNVRAGSSPYDLVRRMRGSSYLLGAEIGRFGHAHVGWPGGCDFGVRPIDQHIKGFEAIGAKINIESGYIEATTPNGINGSQVYFDVVSVGATINLILASVMANGNTVIDNAAKEPHIVDLANFLNTCGANITGVGTDVIKIKGVKKLHGCTYAIIPDMIEAGTYMIAAAATKGNVRITNVIPKHLDSITAKLEEMGVEIEEHDDSVIVRRKGELNRVNVKTLPYPGFPTDMHPQMTSLLCLAHGVSYVTEGVFENRFKYVDELRRMGASIKVDGKTAIIEGGHPLSGAPVIAVDLRAGAAMIIAGLVATGKTEISEISSIERGYDDIVGKLHSLGANIKKIQEPDTIYLPKAN